MISFTPTEEQEMLISAVRKYAENDLRKNAHEHDENSAIPHNVMLKGWEIGLIPASLPEAFGGFGEHSAVTNVLALEELAYGDLAGAMKLMTPGLFAYPVHFSGTEDQKARFLPLFAEEKPYPATAALLEPSITFDPFALKTTATVESDCIVLNGEKAYVPLADGAEWMIVYARNTETGRQDGYLVESKQVEGLTLQGREKLMGVRGLETYRVKLNNVRIPTENRLGGAEGTNYDRIISHMNVALSALATGVARASFEFARDYAKGRIQFGKPIATKQAIAFLIAECAIEVDSMRLLTWEAAWQIDAGKPEAEIQKAAYLARQYADKAVLTITDAGVQILGGHGFIREYPQERFLRNGRGFPMFTGLAIA